jgi:hypothetical protein
MRCTLISDLHLEFQDLILPGGDVLLLAGDVCEAKNLKMNLYNKNIKPGDLRRPDRYARFFVEECAKYRKVFYIMGNHEHYGYKFHKTYDYLKSMMPANVSLLEKESVEFDGVIFIGATLWSDFNNGDPTTMWEVGRSMNDFRIITMYNDRTGVYHKFTTERAKQDHNEALTYIDQAVKAAGNLPVVVMTHHYPSHRSIHPKYANDYCMNGGFGSNLDQFILDRPQIMAFHHGHTHDRFSYNIGSTWISCNPRGYIGYESAATDFKPRSYDIIDGKICNIDNWDC